MVDVEIQLSYFYQSAFAMIETKRAAYLKSQKVIAHVPNLPEIIEVTPEEYAKMNFFQRVRYKLYYKRAQKRYKKALRKQRLPLNERLTKGFNAGMEAALDELEKAYKIHLGRLKNN